MRISAFSFIILLIVFSSCSDDDTLEPATDEGRVNAWIYDVMDDIYFWSEELPGEPDRTLSPEDFFESLLNDEDRFSVIRPDYGELVNALNGVNTEAGYEFRVVRSDDAIYAVVTYIKQGSQADATGLQRGDRITAINSTTLAEDNYRTLLINDISQPHEISFSRFDEGMGEFVAQNPVNVSTTQYQENPNFLDTIYDINQRKIGYYVYNFFAEGENRIYRNQMDQIIGRFKSEGVTDLILDLRYNSGGFIISATNLASLLVTGASNDDIFFQNQWNPQVQRQIEDTEDGDAILRQRFFNKNDNIGSQIGGRVYILVGRRTASASELVINGLLPFMDVVLIGEQTIGKNVGSVAIDDENNEDNNYGLLPIVFRSANADGDSDYGQGFQPSGANEIAEFDFRLLPLGDINETLLAQALSQITGQSLATRSRRQANQVESLLSSRSLKAYAERSIQMR